DLTDRRHERRFHVTIGQPCWAPTAESSIGPRVDRQRCPETASVCRLGDHDSTSLGGHMRQPRYRWLALFAALGLVAGACGSDDDEGGDGAGDEADFEAVAYDESAQCGTDGYAGNLAGIEAVDELTVRFTLCEPDVAFPAKVAFSALGIHPSEHLEATGGAPIDNPIGTGPYRLEAWERGSQNVLTANEDYWGEPPSIPTVVFRWSAESAQRLVELQSGDVDGIDNVGTEDFATVQDDPDLQLLEREPLNVFYLGFNVDK